MDSLIDLVCPTCKSDLVSSDFNLECRKCERMFPVQLKIPRFVPEINYTNSFGLQWNRFVGTQLDSAQGTNRSRDRFMSETQWTENDLSGKFVLDAGCGAGRFSEIALSLGAKLIGVDFSSSTNAAASNLNSGEKLIIQSDLSALPLKDQSMDFIYCIGVLQHTSAPETIVKELFRCLKIGGEITLTFFTVFTGLTKLSLIRNVSNPEIIAGISAHFATARTSSLSSDNPISAKPGPITAPILSPVR